MYISMRPSPKFLMSFFVVANFFNYMDRGIIPGAATEFDGFIEGSVEFDDDINDVDTYLGILQSSYIVGISVSMPIFGNLVHTKPPFRLVGIGLTVWCIAAVLAGLSRFTNSFSALVCARVLSGVGEASFQVIAGPYIQDNAGAEQGKWLGFYYTAIPFGTCVGYGFGAAMASVNWSFAFYLEAMLMAPLALLCFLVPRYDFNTSLYRLSTFLFFGTYSNEIYKSNIHKQRATSEDIDNILRVSVFSTAEEEEDARRSSQKELVEEEDEGNFKSQGVSIWEEVVICLSSPLFVCSMLGYAAYSGGLIGFATYGPQIVMGLGYFNSEFAASIIFGGVMAFAGLLGTPLGGLMLDWKLKRSEAPSVPIETVVYSDLTTPLTADDAPLAQPVRLNKQSPDLYHQIDEENETTMEVSKEPIVPIYHQDGVLDHDLHDYIGSSVLAGQLNLIGMLIAAICIFDKDKYTWLGAFAIGGLFLFASNTSMNLSILESVPKENRSFATGFSSLLMHLFGDVPSPIVVGTLKDIWAPHCTPETNDDGDDDDNVSIPDACDHEQTGLRTVSKLNMSMKTK